MAQTSQQAKLCPHCANSIALDAVKCPYCKAALSAVAAPQWAERSAVAVDASPVRTETKSGRKFAVIAAALAVALAGAGAFVFSHWPGNQGFTSVADNSSELRDKDQKMQILEAELAKLREGNQGSSGQLDELKAKLSESQKDLAETERKLADANREIDRLRSSRADSMARSAPRANEPAAPAPAAPPPARARRPSSRRGRA